MKYTAFSTTLILIFAIANVAGAGQIYKWTDAEGNVHYGDKPVAEQAEQLAIRSTRTDPARIEAMATAREEARAVATAEELAAADDAPSREELLAEAREREQKCTMYRQRLDKFVTSRRLYREDEEGERVYLDEAQTQAARERVQNQVEEFCNS